jgi:hypothetical protein
MIKSMRVRWTRRGESIQNVDRIWQEHLKERDHMEELGMDEQYYNL